MSEEIQAMQIGEKLRQRRELRGLTTIELAKRCDLSEARLMAMEQGFSMPTISVLLRIARELGVDVGFFFQDAEVRRSVEIVRAADRIKVAQERKEGISEGLYYDYEALTVNFPGAAMRPFHIEIDTGDHSQLEAAKHKGQEFIYVLEGEVEWRSEEESHRLTTGDSIYFNSEIPHRIIGLGPKKPKVLSVIYEPVES
ncbi:MAG: cupin domain-containing protein [Polyangia bacterium]|jgi:transcriptional regulator with XRE-family HTH domain|nr:cupin domain-containing protein [Polyangia bacterium]